MRSILIISALFLLSLVCGQDDLLAHTQPDSSNVIDSLIVASCYSINGRTTSDTFSRIVSQNPDLLLWVGDNIYGDTYDMAVMRQKYDDKKNTDGYRTFLEASIPVMANWDDHDFGWDNEGKYYSQREESQLEFLRHFDIPQEDPRYSAREGVYSSKIFGTDTGQSLHVIMLDNRFDRSPTYSQYGECEGEGSSMMSEEQWQWLELELSIPSELKVITNGIQILPPTNLQRPLERYCAYGDGDLFNGAIDNLGETGLSGTQYESWAEIPTSRERLLRMVQGSINQGFAKNIILVSGDQHWGELLQKTMPTDSQAGDEVTLFELTASGVGQNWGSSSPNPYRLPVWADFQGDGIFSRPCIFPFNYESVKYEGCVYNDPDYEPWCYTQVDSDGNGVVGVWGFCAPPGTIIPTGQVGTVAEDVASQTTRNRHIIDLAESNYGKIDIDWENERLTLSIQNHYEEVVSTIIPFRQDRMEHKCSVRGCNVDGNDLGQHEDLWNRLAQTVYAAFRNAVQKF